MADEKPEAQQDDHGNGVFPASPDVPVDDTPAPAKAQRSRLAAPALGNPRAPKTHVRNTRIRRRTCNDARGDGSGFARSCQDDRLPKFCAITGVAYRKCPSCHVSVRQEACLCKGAQSGLPKADEAERLTTSTGPNGWTLVGTGRQFPATDHTRSPQYPPDVTLGDDGVGGEEENQEIILDGIVSSPRLDQAPANPPPAKNAVSPNPTVVDPSRVVAGVCLKARHVSDGEACYPPYEASLDGNNDDDRTECETEYPSNGSTYGSVSDDEAYMSDAPTFSTASVSSSFGSFELIEQAEVAGSRTHTGAKDKGKGAISNEGNNYHGEIGYGSPYGQKRGGRDEDVGGRGKRPKNNPPADQESGESDDNDSEKRFACPFFKNYPSAHGKCRMWSDPSLSRVKGHVLRVHLKPLQCPRCGIFRAGDDGQIKKHLRDSSCEKPTTFVPVDESTVWKGKDLKKGSKKAVTWQQVYMVLFDCQQHEVPSPYFALSSASSENDTVVGDSFQPVGAISAPAATPSTDGRATNVFSEMLSDSGFQRFAQEWLTKALAQQLPQLIAGHLSQILDEYVREATLEHDNPQRAASSTALSGPSSNVLMRTTTYPVPFAATTSLEGPNVASQSVFSQPQRLSPQPTSYNPMPMYMSAPLPGTAMAIGQQHAHRSYPAGGGDNVYTGSYPANDEESLSVYLHSDMGDYHFVDIERLE